MISYQEKLTAIKTYLSESVLDDDMNATQKRHIVSSLLSAQCTPIPKYFAEEFINFLYISIGEDVNSGYSFWCLREAFQLTERVRKENIKSVNTYSKEIAKKLKEYSVFLTLQDSNDDQNSQNEIEISQETINTINKIMKL